MQNVGLDGIEQGIVQAAGLTSDYLRNRCFDYAIESAKTLTDLCRARDIYLASTVKLVVQEHR